MREFERAIERGEDAAVATFVLEQLRKVVRGTEEDDERGREPTIRRGCCSVRSSRFWSRAIFRCGPGRSGAASLLPVWQWLERDGAPDAARRVRSRAGRDQAERQRPPASKARPAISSSPQPMRSSRSPTPAAGDDRQRSLARIGPPNVVEDLVVDRRRAAGARGAGDARQPDAGPDAGSSRRPDRVGECGAQRSLACRRRSCCRSRCR